MNTYNGSKVRSWTHSRFRWAPILVIVFCSSTFAGGTRFRVTDDSGADVQDVLVIVQDLHVRDADEVFRALTDQHGRTSSRQLPSGLYRIIATDPYGLWKTDIRELLIGPADTEISVSVKPLPTHGYGDVVPIGDTQFLVRVIQRDGTPVEGIEIHARDADASLFTRQWRKTDERGEVSFSDMGREMVLVIVADGRVITKEVAKGSKLVVIRLP